MSKNIEGFKAKVLPVWKPKAYQDDGVKWLTSRPAAALFWKPGLGKTTTVLAAFEVLRQRKMAKRMLVIAPLKVCQGVWRQEADKWKNFKGLFNIGFAHGANKHHILADKKLDIVLLNYDGLLWAAEKLVANEFDIVVYDELTRMKHTNTQRFKRFRKCLAFFKFRWGLTGSPAPNGLMDLFGQVFVLDGGNRLGHGITRFRKTFFHQKPFDQWTWYPNTGTDRKITKLLSNLANYVDENKWNKMPGLINVPIEVDIGAPALKQYKELEREYILQLKDDAVTASTAAVLSLKLRQCASGAVYDAERKPIRIHEAKLDALESLIEELSGDPILVSVGFHHEVDAIRKRLGKINGQEIPYLGGGLTAATTDKIIKQWNLGWLPVCMVHPTSVAHGLNLQAGGCNIGWYSLTWNLEEYEQLIRRLYRQGQLRKVMNYMLLSKGTIDTFMYGTLNQKGMTQVRMFDMLKQYYAV